MWEPLSTSLDKCAYDRDISIRSVKFVDCGGGRWEIYAETILWHTYIGQAVKLPAAYVGIGGLWFQDSTGHTHEHRTGRRLWDSFSEAKEEKPPWIIRVRRVGFAASADHYDWALIDLKAWPGLA